MPQDRKTNITVKSAALIDYDPGAPRGTIKSIVATVTEFGWGKLGNELGISDVVVK